MRYLKIGCCLLLPFLAMFVRSAETDPTPLPVPEHLGGTFTGGFGEQTCHSCHFDYPLNPEEGSVRLKGLPERYRPGTTYPLTVTVSAPGMERGGFQLSVRHSDSTQAGSFRWPGDRLQFTRGEETVQYLQHTRKGTETEGDTLRWTFEWTAPASGRAAMFHLAANAGNGDESAFGDLIHTLERKLEAADGDR